LIPRRFRGFIRAAAVAAFSIASCPALLAQPAGPGQVFPPLELPDKTPSGQAAMAHLEWVLNLMTGAEGAGEFDPARFAPVLMRQVQSGALRDAITNFGPQHGGAEPLGKQLFDARTARAGLKTGADDKLWMITLRVEDEPPYRIDTLSLEEAPAPRATGYDGWALLDADLNGLGIASAFSAWEVKADGSMKPLHRLRAERRMSIGTAAVLFVVGAAAQFVADGHAAWDQPLAIDPALISIPPGEFAELPPDLDPPLAEFARAALAKRDMTAADHLLALVGRDRALARLRSARAEAFRLLGRETDAQRAETEELSPFLSVHELYRIKCAIDGFLVKEYAEATPEEQRRLLENEVAQSEALPQFVVSWRRPQELLKVGWLVSPDDMCIELGRLWTMSKREGMGGLAYALEPAESEPFDARVWRRVTAIRGGEPGSIAVAWIAERIDGRVFVVSMVVNDEWKPVATRTPQRILLGVVGLLGRV